MKKKLLLFGIGIIAILPLFAQDRITEKGNNLSFPIVSKSAATTLYVAEQDHPVVKKAVALFQQDIEAVTGKSPQITYSLPAAPHVIIIGSLDKSPVIQQLVQQKKLKAESIKGKWEAYGIQLVHHPFKGVEKALVIAGSDRRGTAYGVLDLSQQMGVSPWYWWADVPVKKKAELYFRGPALYNAPKVKYRGIFINDEAPALSGWSREKFGGFNHKFYEKVFELILRLKGNYLWPAMWGSAFNDDDTLNPVMADQYAIVMGTSHHEPMVRAHDEWRRYGTGKWNYATNEQHLQNFWRKGIQRMGNRENIVTIGMRGDGDEPMTEGTAISLLERIVKDQRKIIQEVTGKKASETPQIWALYKEVQDYYDKGMRVPEDVTLLLADDNWGNIRKLPKPGDPVHPGGYGIYYHFDYVGGPRNYKWINTNPIARVWEQMHLAYQHGADRIWIVNVGDIKPMEYPISFFLDYAWDPTQWPLEKLGLYTKEWAQKQFGAKKAEAIAHLLIQYTKFNGRRKPELLSPDTYSLTHYREAERIVAEYKELLSQAEQINKALPAEYHSAFYQLVLHPIEASANLNELYVTVGKNRLYARQGRASTNSLAQKARALYANDSAITHYYNRTLSGGKWNHLMDQTHIGYTYWQQPEKNSMPEVKTIAIPQDAQMGVAVEGQDDTATRKALPPFQNLNPQTYYAELYNKGNTPFPYTITTTAPWINVSAPKGIVETEKRVWISIDWQKAPKEASSGALTISGPGGSKETIEVILQPASVNKNAGLGFAETDGHLSMEAASYNKAINSQGIQWKEIPHLGKTVSGVTPFPVTAKAQTPGGNSPHLQYNIYLHDTGTITIHTLLSPTLDYYNQGGMKFAVSIDEEPPQIINMHEGYNERLWEQWVANNIIEKTSQHRITKPGQHVLKFWMIDPGVVLQKLIIDAGGLKQSYLGPPETSIKEHKK